MTNLVLAEGDALLIDYVAGVAYRAGLAVSQAPGLVSIELGRHGASGVALDQANLKNQFDSNTATTGTPPLLRFRLEDIPSLAAPVATTITFRMTGGTDASRDGTETQVELSIAATLAAQDDGSVLILAQAQTADGRIYKGSSSPITLKIIFAATDQVAVAHRVDGAPVLDLSFFAFLPKLDGLSSLVGLEGNYYLQIEGDWPIATADGQAGTDFAILMPISEASQGAANQAPQLAGIANQALTEDAALELALAAPDPEGQAVSFSIVSGGGAATVAAAVNGDRLTLTPAPDYSGDTPIDFTLKATDASGAYNTLQFAVTVTGQNDAPTGISLLNATHSLAENADTASRIKLADLVVADDGLGANSLTLSGADAASFEIAGGGLYLKAGVALDYEAQQGLAVRVTAADTELGGTPVMADFSLAVTNLLDSGEPFGGPVHYWGQPAKPIGQVFIEGALPVRSTTTADRKAVTLTDVLQTLKHYLGKTQLSGHAVTAADYNADGKVGLSDVLGILKTYLGKTAPPAWHFEPAPGEPADNPAELVGVLRGDVDGSWNGV